ncbi:Os01g0794900, partial [Oryza sativa Japonica Group]
PASPLRPQPSSSPPVFIGGRPPANATPSSQRPSQLAQRRHQGVARRRDNPQVHPSLPVSSPSTAVPIDDE